MAYAEKENATDARRDPRARILIKRLQSLGENADQLLAACGQTADRIIGAEMQIATDKRKEVRGLGDVVPSGFLGEMDSIVAELERTLSLAIEQARRIEREF